jgi:DNA-binding NarL/FixJ family response regulator
MLSGLRAIVVEDNFAVAYSLSVLLESLGCEVAGKAANVRSGCELAETVEYDVAILDISLGDCLVTEVARKVADAGKRIVYLTGFSGAELLPDDLRSHVCLAKPVRTDALIEAM